MGVGRMRRFEEMPVWQASRTLANLIYDLTEQEPFARDFGLKGQIQRAAVSVMSNIAEGFESRTVAQFVEYLGRAKASAGEVRSQLYLAHDRHYISAEQFKNAHTLVTEISRQLYGLMKYMQDRPHTTRVEEEQAEYFTEFIRETLD